MRELYDALVLVTFFDSDYPSVFQRVDLLLRHACRQCVRIGESMPIAVGSYEPVFKEGCGTGRYGFYSFLVERSYDIVAEAADILQSYGSASSLVKFMHEKRKNGRVDCAVAVLIYLSEYCICSSRVYKARARIAYHVTGLSVVQGLKAISVPFQTWDGSAVLFKIVEIVFPQAYYYPEIRWFSFVRKIP